MSYNEELQALLQKEVTRKQFVVHIGLSMLALIGLPALLKNLNGALLHPQAATKPEALPALQPSAYGESVYSGLPKGRGLARTSR